MPIPACCAVAERLAAEPPDLALPATGRSSGLPYDSTPILARGGRAITLTAPERRRFPTTTGRPTPPTGSTAMSSAGALEAGREMIAAIDRGEADRLTGVAAARARAIGHAGRLGAGLEPVFAQGREVDHQVGRVSQPLPQSLSSLEHGFDK